MIAVNYMEKSFPSSVTVEEAVAKMIGFDYLPDSLSLLDSIEFIINATEQDLAHSIEDNLEVDCIRYRDELSDWTSKLSRAEQFLLALEIAVDKDRTLKKVDCDTARNRVTKHSVYQWAKKHHKIKIETWDPLYRTSYAGLSSDEVKGRRLLLSIGVLCNELLCRVDKNWNEESLNADHNSTHRYLNMGKPNVNAISIDIASRLQGSKTGKNLERATWEYISQSISAYQTHTIGNSLYFSKRECTVASRTLVGLYRLLVNQPFENGAVDVAKEKLAVIRFVEQIHVSERIQRDELVRCIADSLNLAIKKSW